MKHLPSFLFGMVFSFYGLIVKGQCTAEIESQRLSNTKFDTECVAAHINKFFSVEEVVDYTVGTVNEQVFLLAQAVDGGNGTWIYLIPLEESNGALTIKNVEELHGCESSLLSIEAFSFVDGQFRGCVKYNHKVATR